MGVRAIVRGPSRQVEDIDQVRGLWQQLHRHHLAVAGYSGLVDDVEASWHRRRQWYVELVEHDGGLWVAQDDGRRCVGYAFATLSVELDDTFESTGTAELVSLVVDEAHRQSGIGRALIRSVETAARQRGIDLFKVAVMTGNEAALRLYESDGFRQAEQVLYRRIPPG